MMQNNTIQQLSGFGSLFDLPCYRLSANGATVVVSPYGAHVLSYQNAAGREILWLSEKAQWQGKKAIRGGVPICWPWFGKAAAEFGAEAAQQPNHGMVRTAMWQPIEQQIAEHHVAMRFCIELPRLPWSPHKVQLHYLVQLSDVLTLELSCDDAVLQQAALHSYFQLPQAEGAIVTPLPKQCFDKVSNRQLQLTDNKLQFQGEIDRVYPDTASLLSLYSPAANSTTQLAHPTLTVAQHGHDASVLWNPGLEKAAAMADMHAGASTQFVCVETAKLELRAAPLLLRQIISA